MMFFERAGAIDIATHHVADLGVIADCRHTRAEPKRRARETRSIRLLGEIEDGDGVGQRTGDRLVDKHRLMRLEDRPSLLEVGPAVDTLQQHDVDLRQQLIDRADDRTPRTCRAALWCSRPRDRGWRNVRAASGIGRHNAHAGNLGLWSRGVQKLRERDTCEVSRPMMPARSGFGGDSFWASSAAAKPTIDKKLTTKDTAPISTSRNNTIGPSRCGSGEVLEKELPLVANRPTIIGAACCGCNGLAFS